MPSQEDIEAPLLQPEEELQPEAGSPNAAGKEEQASCSGRGEPQLAESVPGAAHYSPFNAEYAEYNGAASSCLP